jgi:hypothetical protein
VVAYWVKDESEGFENSTQFIDHSMGLVEAVISSDILDKASNLGSFLFKTHLLSAIEKYSAPKKGLSVIKRKLGEMLDG